MKWSQWSKAGLECCGDAPLSTIMDWMTDIGTKAVRDLGQQSKPHALYGMKVCDENGSLQEIRFYRNTYLTDEELDKISRDHPHNIIYACHNGTAAGGAAKQETIAKRARKA